MMTFIRKKLNKGKTYYYIVESVRDKDKIKQRVIRYIGTIETLIKKLDIADKILKKR
ncbi:hypothetical protein HZB88_00930 [archaeon]|nr:hypothetical protein [archaeon]